MKLVVTAFVTLDGVMEGPGHDEHRDGKNAWALGVQGEEDVRFNKELLLGADAILLGRKTYQIWAAFWPNAEGSVDDELAERLNEMPKYVVSKTLERPRWNNSIPLTGDVVDQVRRLKEQAGGELLVYGSADLVDTLLEHDLIDEFRILVYPVILGSGKHLFRDRIDTHHLRLVDSHVFGSGVVLLTYRPQQAAPTSIYVGDYSWTEEQVRSLQAAENVDRVLATVLFTDVVDSTGRAVALGDRQWRKLIDHHDEMARVEVSRWLGQFVKATGDGLLATFDSPTRALLCAFSLRDGVERLDLEIRASIHTGEIERRDSDVAGIGVHIASRALDTAAPGQVVVTRTVRDLATGTDLGFAPLGQMSLRGVPGQWELFAASVRHAQ